MKLYYVDRKTQIKHFTDLSFLEQYEETNSLSLRVPAKENFVVQFALLPEKETEIREIHISGHPEMYCLNTQIVDKFGKSFQKAVELKKQTIQPLFFILPANPQNAHKREEIKIHFVTDCGENEVTLAVNYTDDYVENGGYNDLQRLSRLNWLNSSRFLNEEVVPPYTVSIVNNGTIQILGREIQIGENGLPKAISYYFDEGINLKSTVQKSLFSAPMRFKIGNEAVTYEPVQYKQNKGTVNLVCKGCSASVEVLVEGVLHYEGFIDYRITLKSKENFTAENIALETTLHPDCAEYMNGLGAVGGKSHNLQYKWTSENHHDCLYVGTVNAGLRLKWKAENYQKPLVNIYYKNLPLVVPKTTWDNAGKGEIDFLKQADYAKIIAQTGVYPMQKGEERSFNFEVHFVPFKNIDYKKHYKVRYYHDNHLTDEIKDVREASKRNLTHMVVHHGNRVHPFINYPFVEVERLKHLVDYAKTQNIGVKVYYTTREHSNHMAEVFAYKALGDEIILRKKGKGYTWRGGTDKWLTEYFGETIIPAWKVTYRWGKYRNDPDVSFIVKPNSRLDNYYIEGLDWLVQNIGIKGIYIDDTAMDRTTIERARKVLQQTEGLIDMHMWNHEEDRAGNVSCMNLYTELFPFLDSLWIGEGYPYKKLSPEYLLTEVSGIPYGQTSQMLQDGGNPYIGMLYAMNNRYGWGVKKAHKIYRLWDDFAIQESEMRGYWHSQNPVDTGEENIKATVYIKKHEALLCLFNFSNDSKTVDLKIDVSKLGFTPKTFAEVKIGKDRHQKIQIEKPIRLQAKGGKIIYLRK